MSGKGIALGRTYINYDPVHELELMQARMGYSGLVGYYIPMSDYGRERLSDVINFNLGRDTTNMERTKHKQTPFEPSNETLRQHYVKDGHIGINPGLNAVQPFWLSRADLVYLLAAIDDKREKEEGQ